MIQPTFKEFCQLAEQGNLIPVYQELLMDLETPLSFFKRLERDRYAFLLESVEGSERWARYSFFGTRPERVFKARGKQVEIIENGKAKKLTSAAPLQLLEELMKGYRPVTVAGVPPFFGGALGYVAYDAVEQFHEITNDKKDPLGMPEIFFLFVQTLIAFDNLKHTIKVIDNVHVEPSEPILRTRLRRVGQTHPQNYLHPAKKTARHRTAGVEPRHGQAKVSLQSQPRSGFQQAVIKAKEYIKAGDIIQAVLCQRLETETDSDPFEIYRALRLLNPSPYMFYLELDDLRVIGSSPETMVRLTGRHHRASPHRRNAAARRHAGRRERARSRPACRSERTG